MSTYGEALLEALAIKKTVGEIFNADEITKIMAFYVRMLEAIVQGDTDYLSKKIAKKLTQININLASNIKPKLTFSGGVGELIYKISANELLPTTTFYGDFGIDLAQAISCSSILSANLKTHIPEHKGRATVVGLTLHSTEISGNSTYLPNPNSLPLRNLPIVAKLVHDSSATQWQSVFSLASNCPQGACIQISASNQLEQIHSLAMQIRHAMQANMHAASRPIILLIDCNIGKALGNYICDWGQLDYNLIVIDEVALRDAQFVNIGPLHQQMIPVSFYGLN
jgi:ethanolamine utilization protein EutA